MSTAVPPRLRRTSSLGWFAGILLGIAVVGTGAVIFFFNPSTHAFYPACQFHQLTGLNCPGCGATRAMYALLHGNFLQAVKDNALLVTALTGAAGWLVYAAIKKMRGKAAAIPRSAKFLWGLLAVAAIFAVVRNLPGFEWLSP